MVKHQERTRHMWKAGVVAGVCLAVMPGCGGTIYAVTAYSASARIETAQALGAEKYAPYEYHYAKEHLQKAQEVASRADYGDALDFADAAEKYAEKAIKLSREAHEGAGR